MHNQELLSYIKTQFQLGVPPAQIRKSLIGNGWDIDAIEAAFQKSGLYSGDAPPSPTNAQSGRGKITELPGVTELFSQSWAIFKSNWQRFVSLSILPLLLGFGFGFLVALIALGGFVSQALGESLNPTAIVVMVLVVLAVIIIFSVLVAWLQLGIFSLALQEGKISVSEALSKAKGKLIAYMWTGFLMGLMVWGGFALFALPGLIFTVWFSMFTLVILEEDFKGIPAMIKSREYVRGIGTEVFVRMFAMGLVIMVVSILIPAVFEGSDLEGFASLVSFGLSLITTPLSAIYVVLLFKNIKALKGDVKYEVTRKRKLKYILVMVWGILGWLIVPALLAMAVLTAINPIEQIQRAQQMQMKSEIMSTRNALEYYYAENGSYPQELDGLSPKYMAKRQEGSSLSSFTYSIRENGSDYELCATFEDGQEKTCVTSQEDTFEFPDDTSIKPGDQPPFDTSNVFEN